MNNQLNSISKLSLVILLILVLAVSTSYFLPELSYGKRDMAKFQKNLNEKVDLLDNVVKELFHSGDVIPFEELKEKGLILIVYENDTIYNWTDNEIQVPYFFDSSFFEKRIHFNSNTWYVVKTYKHLNFSVAGFIPVKKEYPYQNRFLNNGFQAFDFPEEIKIVTQKEAGNFSVFDWENKFLFSLSYEKITKYPFLQEYLSPFLYFLSFLLILQLVTLLFNKIEDRVQKNWALAGFALLFFAIRFIQTFLRFPEALYQTDLFSPLQFANSDFLPSLGDLLLNTIILTFFIIKFNTDFYLSPPKKIGQKSVNISIHIFCIIIIGSYYLYSYHIFKSLIINSSISFEAFKLTRISFYSIVGLIIIGLQFASLFFLINKVSESCKAGITIERVIYIFSFVLMSLIILLAFTGFRIDMYSVLFFYLIFITLILIRYKRDNLHSYSLMVILIFFFSVYSVYFITKTTELKGRQDMVILAENVATEHDPVAELLLEEMSNRMNSDTLLADMMFDMNVSYQFITKHLQNKYFTGYLGKYNFQFFDCRVTDTVNFDIPEKISYPCYAFFNDLIDEKGMHLPNSNFYYIDNINGRVNYLGKITYHSQFEEITIFIELESKFLSEKLGYPELLLDDNYREKSYLSGYSYSKYHNDVLVTKYGNFHYSLDRNVYGEKESEFTFLRFDDFDHLIYNIDKENSVIISKPVTGIFDMLISFSYIFVFYYLLLLATLVSFKLSKFNYKIQFNFKNKIQISIISILILSLILVGGGTIYFSIEQYQKKNNENISEKLQSVYVELDHKIAYEEVLGSTWSSPSYDNLEQLLIKLSDVFYSDINIYSPAGDLLATSRPEIFDQELTGTLMNPNAYLRLARENKAEYVHKEKIGKLEYISGYIPYININNKVLAYINLPYFTKQDELRKEITTLAVAIVNIYVLLILLTIAVTIIISDKITKPLRILQEKFGQIKLLNNHELIEYDGNDEVADLVAEYNRMVQELHNSAELLAKSERESAWRGMAKQVAHEIKNPLTPMKLTVQHLQRAWKDKKDNYAEIQEKVTKTLIEQIDNLSKIASEFSNFAQMPKAKNEKINIVEKINNTIGLFSNTSDFDFIFNSSVKNDVFIYADREQISRVLINLITNAIQSVPEDRKGIINILLEKNSKKVVIKISDNGKGIPDELKDKLFVPNFTTKSSGMGLGLAITKNIIENSKGSIRFETTFDVGTTFIIEFPIEE